LRPDCDAMAGKNKHWKQLYAVASLPLVDFAGCRIVLDRGGRD